MRAPPGDRSIDDRLAFGVVNLDKPAGPTAHQVSAWVRDMTGVDRAAHAGTLDPKVTGCLPVLTGAATRLAPALLGAKEYVVVLELHADPPDDLEAVLAGFEGPIYQRPPRKSAVARELRVRELYALDLLERDGRRALLRVECESGTYVRKLCHDLGLVLGTGANMGDLRRVGTTPFDDADLVTLHDLADALAAWRDDGDETPLRSVVSPGERAVAHLPRVTVAANVAETVANGSPIYAPGVISADGGRGDLVACYTPDGTVVCLGRLVGDPDAATGEVVTLERVLV